MFTRSYHKSYSSLFLLFLLFRWLKAQKLKFHEASDDKAFDIIKITIIIFFTSFFIPFYIKDKTNEYLRQNVNLYFSSSSSSFLSVRFQDKVIEDDVKEERKEKVESIHLH